MMKVLLDHMAANGVLMIETGSAALSTPMTEKEIDVLSEVMLGGFRKVKSEMATGQPGATQ
jgi:glutamate-1-semialdehyde 2,1-aminomutase